MNKKTRSAILAAAMTGLVGGAVLNTGCAGSQSGMKSATAAGKHSCAGQNTCKGLGGCKTGDMGCKGKNTCKGKGGCAVG